MVCFIMSGFSVDDGLFKKKQEMVKDDRIWWCETAYKISYPVFREPLFVFGGI